MTQHSVTKKTSMSESAINQLIKDVANSSKQNLSKRQFSMRFTCDTGRRIVFAWILLSGSLLGLGCRSQSTYNKERIALWKEAEAIEARHQALDTEIAAWSESVGAWAKKNQITIDPAQLVLSLSSRSYFMHQLHPGDTTQTDPGYEHLEDQMKQIQAKQRQIEADWKDLLTRDRASIDRTGLKPVESRQSFEYDFGDSTIPIPGVMARGKCCPLTTTVTGSTGCKLVSEFCVKPTTAGGKWQVWCMYVCDPKPVYTARLNRREPGLGFGATTSTSGLAAYPHLMRRNCERKDGADRW